MEVAPQILHARVMHRRIFPRVNRFRYRIFCLCLPLPSPALPGKLVRFDPQDLGRRDGSDPGAWARALLADYALEAVTAKIMLVTMPKVLGYVFNPVSFYLCLDAEGRLRAVIAEVHNTFGEVHAYLCAHPGHAPISETDWLSAQKQFHVSPFLPRAGEYRFRFAPGRGTLAIQVNYHAEDGRAQLMTSISGELEPLTAASLRRAAWRYPLVTLKAMTLIHWQALKLVFRRIRYISRPAQYPHKTTPARRLDAPRRPHNRGTGTDV